MKKKLLIAVLCLALSVLSLASCEGLFGGDGKKEETKKTVFSAIVHDGTELDLQEVLFSMRDIVGPMVTLNAYTDKTAADGEVVFGNTDRPITLAAKAALEERIDDSSKYDCGYIVYTDGKSIAVYWDVDGMADIAIQDFIDTVLEEKRLDVKEGELASELYIKRDFENDKYWLTLEAQTTPDVVAAIRSLYNYFDGHKIAGWCANLYDPELGGFYYSNSARDTEGYLPDIESTSQLIGTLVSIGAISNRNTAFPNDIKAKIVEFAKSLQSAEDGYFYHPQWPQGRENLQTDRYGRDIGSATNIITGFMLDMDGDGVGETAQYPNWCAPNGVKCALHTGTEDKCSFPVATSYYSDRLDGSVVTTLSSTVSSAVSKLQSSTVAPTADDVSSHPDYTSAADFEKWLRAYNASILEDSGKAHNLSAIQSEIVEKGYGQIVMNYLNEKLHESFANQKALGLEPTGLWQSDINYQLVWSLLKYATWYNSSVVGCAFPEEYLPYAVKSCIKVTALEPDGEYRMNDLYNQWTSIESLLRNIDKYYPESKKAEAKETVYSIIRENATDLVANSLAKIEPFKMEDGSFAYQSNGLSMTSIYGTPIASGVREGDVNALALVTGMYSAIFTSLGLPKVPLCNAEDGEYFISELLGCEPVDKIYKVNATHDFESGKMPTEVTTNFSSDGAYVSVVEDPENSDNNVLCFTSTAASVGDYLKIKPTSHGSTCYIFETDIYVSSECKGDYLFQVMMGTRFMFTIHKKGDVITIKSTPSTSHSNGQETICSFNVDEWHKFRVEYYVHGTDTGLETPKIKLWLDNEFLCVSDNYYGSYDNKLTVGNYSTVDFYSMKTVDSKIYLDNCFVSSDDKTFDADDREISDYRN